MAPHGDKPCWRMCLNVLAVSKCVCMSWVPIPIVVCCWWRSLFDGGEETAMWNLEAASFLTQPEATGQSHLNRSRHRSPVFV